LDETVEVLDDSQRLVSLEPGRTFPCDIKKGLVDFVSEKYEVAIQEKLDEASDTDVLIPILTAPQLCCLNIGASNSMPAQNVVDSQLANM